MSTGEYYYSDIEDCECWTHSDIDDVINGMDIGDGCSEITIYREESAAVDVLVAAGSVIDDIADSAYDQAGEVSEGWPSLSLAQMTDLERNLTATLIKYLEQQNAMPKFFAIKNIKAIKVNPRNGEVLSPDHISAGDS